MARLWLAESKYVIELLKGGHGMEEERPERGCRRPTAAGGSPTVMVNGLLSLACETRAMTQRRFCFGW